MRRWKLVPLMLLVGVIALGVSCGSSTCTLVDAGKAEEVVSIENGKLVLTYHFSKPINPSSVILNTTFFVRTDMIDAVAGKVDFPDEKTLRFVSDAPVEELMSPEGGKIAVELLGTSPFKYWVADANDIPIDGDCDGTAGGNFLQEYSYTM